MTPSILLSLLAFAPSAHAEGSAELPGQWLLVDNVLYVDIEDAESERIAFEGAGSMSVRAPDGTDVGFLLAGAELPLNGLPNGAYELRPQQEQRDEWDISVVGGSGSGSRLFSYDWNFDARGYADTRGFDGEFYALVDGGEDGAAGVIAIELNGWAGHRWNALATSHGVDGWDAGRSLDRYQAIVEPSIPLYLGVPSSIGSEPLTPSTSGLTYTLADDSDRFGGFFAFSVSARGTWRIVCDNDADGVVDPTNNKNVVLSGVSDGPEDIEVDWDGHTWDGGYISGSGECGVTLSIGEMHFLADDIETAYPGLRTFVVDGSNRSAAAMFWNDTLVADNDVPMENGVIPAKASGPAGLNPGSASDAPEADVNARAWGDYMDQGRGDRSMLDTWTFLKRSAPEIIQVDDFGGPGDRNDATNDFGSGYIPPTENEPEAEPATGYFKGGCSTVGAASLGGWTLAFLGGLVVLRRRRADV